MGGVLKTELNTLLKLLFSPLIILKITVKYMCMCVPVCMCIFVCVPVQITVYACEGTHVCICMSI